MTIFEGEAVGFRVKTVFLTYFYEERIDVPSKCLHYRLGLVS